MARNNNTENLSPEEKAFHDAKKLLYFINATVMIKQKYIDKQILSLFRTIRSSSKNNKKHFVDIKKLRTDIKTNEDDINNTKKDDMFVQKLISLDLMLLEIIKEFVTKIEAASELKYRERKKSLDKIEPDCIEVEDFLTKCSGQLDNAAGILKNIFEKIRQQHT